MQYQLLSESSNYKIYRTKHIFPMEEDTDALVALMEFEVNYGFKLQTIFYYKTELIIVFSSIK